MYYCLILNKEIEHQKISDIYREHRHKLFAYALKVVNNNRELAEDAIHNAFIAIIEQKDKYLLLKSEDFLYSTAIIVRNKCVDLLRKEEPYDKIPIEHIEFSIPSNDIPVEEEVITAIEYEKLCEYLKSIDDISQQVLKMKYCYKMTYKEIGKKLGMTPKHVDTRIMRAKEKVRKLIEKETLN